MGATKTLLIVDDHTLFREGLKTIISRNQAYEVVGETGRGETAIQMAKSLRPEPDSGGHLPAGPERHRTHPSAAQKPAQDLHHDGDHAFQGRLYRQGVSAGATGFVTKDSAPERLLQAIDVVLKGEYFMDSAVSQKVVQRLAGVKADHRSLTDAGYETLTPREQEILALLAEGQALKSISERLFISPKTVENHRTSIMRKLGVHSTFGLIRYAAKVGIIDIDLWKE